MELFFHLEKDSSVYVTASTKSGSNSRGRCQPMPDVAFPMENTLHERGSKEHTRRGLRCGGHNRSQESSYQGALRPLVRTDADHLLQVALPWTVWA